MRKTVLYVATFLGALSCYGSVNAAEAKTALVPLPSIEDFTNGDGWGFGLGLGVEYETAYEGSDEFELARISHSYPASLADWADDRHDRSVADMID